MKIKVSKQINAGLNPKAASFADCVSELVLSGHLVELGDESMSVFDLIRQSGLPVNVDRLMSDAIVGNASADFFVNSVRAIISTMATEWANDQAGDL